MICYWSSFVDIRRWIARKLRVCFEEEEACVLTLEIEVSFLSRLDLLLFWLSMFEGAIFCWLDCLSKKPCVDRALVFAFVCFTVFVESTNELSATEFLTG